MVLADGKGSWKTRSSSGRRRGGATLSIFLGRKDLAQLSEFFGAAYPADAPAVVFEAGYSGLEKVVRTNVREFRDVIEKARDNDLFLLFHQVLLEAGAKHTGIRPGPPAVTLPNRKPGPFDGVAPSELAPVLVAHQLRAEFPHDLLLAGRVVRSGRGA